MIPATDFHCKTTWFACSSGRNSAMHLLILWFRFTSQMAILSNIHSILIARPECALCFLAGKRKYIFAQESLYLQGILDDINEQNTSFVDCKHKHMMKS